MQLERGRGQRKGERGVSARDEVDQMLTLWFFHAKQQNIQFITVSFREQHHPRVFVEIRSSWQIQMSFISHLTSGLLCADLGWECSRGIVLVFLLLFCFDCLLKSWSRDMKPVLFVIGFACPFKGLPSLGTQAKGWCIQSCSLSFSFGHALRHSVLPSEQFQPNHPLTPANKLSGH